MQRKSEAETAESGRDRVRRILIRPLQDDGMRFRAKTPEEDQKRYLERLADGLAYLSDGALDALGGWARCHGDGSDRSFWPPMVTMISTAEALQPRPLEEVPGVASWFASRAGTDARAAGRLVAEFLWWRDKKRPPLDDRERQRIVEREAEWRRQIELTRDRIRRGVRVDHADMEFLRWYEETEARALELVRSGDVKRAVQEVSA